MLQFRYKLKKRSRTLYIVLHHTDSENTTIETIHKWHLEKGWFGCGYHRYIREDGSTYQGRPDDTIGAHTIGYNHDSIGVCLEGNFTKRALKLHQEQALIKVLVELREKYPEAVITDHRSFNNTDCPAISTAHVAYINHKVEKVLVARREVQRSYKNRKIDYLKDRIKRMLKLGRR